MTSLCSKFNDVSLSENDMLLGLNSGSLTGLQERAISQEEKARQARNRERRNSSQITELLDQLQLSLAKLNREIAALESAFEKIHGDAWRETLALEILDEDDIPAREQNESIEDYRVRLERLLMNELLNPDGSIRAEYKDHPTLTIYAEWAQKKYHLNQAKQWHTELKDPNTTPERRSEIINALEDSLEAAVFTAREAAEESPYADVSGALDKIQDQATANAVSADAALKFNS